MTENRRFEYRVENIEDKDLNSEESTRSIKDFLTKAGEDGWEVVDVTPSQYKKEGIGGDKYILKNIIVILKR